MIATIKFENLSIGRKGMELIHPFNTEISNANLIILTGANGVGKSTLLKTIVGLLPKTAGNIFINGKVFNHYNSEQLARIFSYLNSKKIDEEYIRVIDLVALGRYPYLKMNIQQSFEREVIDYYLKEMGIDSIRNKFLNEISDGELQKANIARTFVQDTPVIIMDEPTAFLDYPSKIQFFKLLRKLAIEKNKIIICATHDVEMAGTYGNYFWHLENRTMTFSHQPIDWEISHPE